MGAWSSSSNRKRRDGYFKTLTFSTPSDLSYGHNSKKQKLSVCMNHTTPQTNRASSSLNSPVSLISKYPDRTKGFSREVHAPVRISRFESSAPAKNTQTTANYRGNLVDKMGMYEKFKYAALRTIRYVFSGKKKEKEVIEIDDENEGSSFGKWEVFGRWKEEKRTVENLDSSVVTDVSNAITNDGNVEKTGLSLLAQLDDDPGLPSYITNDGNVEKTGLSLLAQLDDDPGLPSYKILYNRSKKRDDKIASINYGIEIEEKRFLGFQSLRPPKIEESIKKDVTEECFVPLTDEEKKEISRSFSNSNRTTILVSHKNSCIDITGEKLQCLKPGAWLNDEVINLYFELLKERERREPQKFLKCHFFNTFFYKKLISGRGGYNFQSLRRWTSQKKLGYSLLECDKIFVPIHKEIHWCLAVINKKDEKLQYLDSLGGSDYQALDALAKYFVDEVKDKCGLDINVSSWEREFVKELPEQLNGFDCGMFMIKYADFYSRGIGLCFSQDDMPYFRQRTAKEILKLRAD